MELLRQHPVAAIVIIGAVAAAVLFIVRRRMANRAPLIQSPLTGAPQQSQRPASVEFAMKTRMAIMGEQVRAEADELAAEIRRATLLANQRFVNRTNEAVQQQLPFEPPGETGAGTPPGSGK